MKDWWKTFFTKESGEILFSDKPPEYTSKEVDRLLKLTRPKASARILDLACGQGRHALELARRGYQVTGLDYCRSYLDDARRAARKEKLGNSVRLIHGDMRTASRHFPADSFDLVIILYTSFGFFDRRSDDLKVLRQIAKLLKPGGQLVINAWSRPGIEWEHKVLKEQLGFAGPAFWQEARTDVFYLDRSRYDAKTGRVFAEFVYVDVKRQKVRKFPFRINLYSPVDLSRMLAICGMRVTRLWGQLIRGPYHTHSTHHTVVAQRL